MAILNQLVSTAKEGGGEGGEREEVINHQGGKPGWVWDVPKISQNDHH